MHLLLAHSLAQAGEAGAAVQPDGGGARGRPNHTPTPARLPEVPGKACWAPTPSLCGAGPWAGARQARGNQTGHCREWASRKTSFVWKNVPSSGNRPRVTVRQGTRKVTHAPRPLYGGPGRLTVRVRRKSPPPPLQSRRGGLHLNSAKVYHSWPRLKCRAENFAPKSTQNDIFWVDFWAKSCQNQEFRRTKHRKENIDLFVQG